MTNNITNHINKLLGVTESYKAPERLMEILYNKEQREELFKNFLKAFDYDLSYDWFQKYYEDEQAERKSKKQDFTPKGVCELVIKLVGKENSRTNYDVCSGTGGLTITKWYEQRKAANFFSYSPADYIYVCEEISERAIPFLLFNLAIRGMNAVVIHCDTISRKCYGIFFIQNSLNDDLGFSNINLMPYSKEVEKEFNVKFVEKKYEEHIEDILIEE